MICAGSFITTCLKVISVFEGAVFEKVLQVLVVHRRIRMLLVAAKVIQEFRDSLVMELIGINLRLFLRWLVKKSGLLFIVKDYAVFCYIRLLRTHDFTRDLAGSAVSGIITAVIKALLRFHCVKH